MYKMFIPKTMQERIHPSIVLLKFKIWYLHGNIWFKFEIKRRIIKQNWKQKIEKSKKRKNREKLTWPPQPSTRAQEQPNTWPRPSPNRSPRYPFAKKTVERRRPHLFWRMEATSTSWPASPRAGAPSSTDGVTRLVPSPYKIPWTNPSPDFLPPLLHFSPHTDTRSPQVTITAGDGGLPKPR
jgi:hypothetical protein